MKQRDPAGVFILTFITIGIYGVVWSVTTKGEMNRLGAQIPTAWIWLIPFAWFYWIWKYAEGVELVTGGASTAGGAFCLSIIPFVNLFAAPVIQSAFNRIAPPASPMLESVRGGGLDR
jgi:hypothetical protein